MKNHKQDEHPIYNVFHSYTVVHYNNNVINKDTIILWLMFICYLFSAVMSNNSVNNLKTSLYIFP